VGLDPAASRFGTVNQEKKEKKRKKESDERGNKRKKIHQSVQAGRWCLAVGGGGTPGQGIGVRAEKKPRGKFPAHTNGQKSCQGDEFWASVEKERRVRRKQTRGGKSKNGKTRGQG